MERPDRDATIVRHGVVGTCADVRVVIARNASPDRVGEGPALGFALRARRVRSTRKKRSRAICAHAGGSFVVTGLAVSIYDVSRKALLFLDGVRVEYAFSIIRSSMSIDGQDMANSFEDALLALRPRQEFHDGSSRSSHGQ
jgi:hypothetical protein